MLALVAAAYLLLALRVRISVAASFSGAQGSLTLSAGAAGIILRFDGEIRRNEKGIGFILRPRYDESARQNKKERGRSGRMAKRFLWLARTGRMEHLELDARIGLGEAGETAIAAGCMRALASALFSVLDSEVAYALHVSPDFGASGFCARACCIFSCQPGDIMLAALKAAVRKSRREGLGWKSIPLRA